MKKLLLLLLPLLLACVARAAKPNVVLLFSDDQRADTIRALGNPHIDTPALDRLVRAGTAFTRAYCMGANQGAVCVPSRAMLMTGRPVFRAHEQMRGQQTWPEKFGGAGYDTFVCGKWHNGPESLLRSFQNGRTLYLGGMGHPYTLKFQDIADGKLVKRPHPNNLHAINMIADSAIEFLKQPRGEKPFLLYVALEAPHDPRVAPPEFHARYNTNKPPAPVNFRPLHPFDNGEMTVRDEKLEAWPRTPEKIRQHLADYYASITHMDSQIGRILDTLKETGADKNTFVVFASDQGLAIGSHGLMGKQNLYEDGMRVPFVIAGPGLPADRRSDAFCYLLDVYPTLGALCGVTGPDGSEGLNLAPVLRGETNRLRDTIHTAYRSLQRAIRDDRWKLIRYPQVDVTQLFDLQTDPHETNNLAANPAHAARIEAMLARLEKEMRAANDKGLLNAANPRPAAWTPPTRAKRGTNTLAGEAPIQQRASTWRGFVRFDFTVADKSCFISAPKNPAPGNPWVWRTSFPDFHAEVDLTLLSNGWHIAYIDCVNMLGCDDALDIYDRFYFLATNEFALGPKPALEAVSRGGLHAYRYAARRPERVGCIYADTPVLDLKSWPFGWKDSKREQKEALQFYGFKDEGELNAFRGNPVDLAESVARARVPLRHVISMNDTVVPPEKNTLELQRRLRTLGHDIDLVVVEKGTAASHGHHFPLPAVAETAAFVMKHTRSAAE
jgi:arylsulfatase A-like enzyme/pimeloyl-ACP methyl ester carboxylesterase